MEQVSRLRPGFTYNKGDEMKNWWFGIAFICDECKMSMRDHTDCMGCEEPMCEGEDKVDMPEGWYHPDCHSDIYG